MSRARRPLGALLTVLVIAGLSVACGRNEQDALREVRAALRKTGQLSYRYVYTDNSTIYNTPIEVKGILEDDLRFKAQLAVDGKPAMEEVVSDDTIADRFFDPTVLKLYSNPEGGRGDTGKRQGDAEEKLASDVEVRSALAAGQWVVDPSGAPPLLGGAVDLRRLSADPVYDSLTMFQYVEQVLRTNFIYEFNEDALDYRPQEDPFADATPEKLFPGRKVKRYDVGRPPLPKASDTVAGNQLTPGMEHFRYMVIYIENGVILRIDETINLELQLEDLRSNYDLDLPDDPQEAIAVSVKAINAVREGQAEPPLIVRDVSLRLASIGEENKIELPQGDDLVVGSLSVLRGRGRSTSGEGLVTVPGSESSQSDPATTEPTAATEPAEGTG